MGLALKLKDMTTANHVYINGMLVSASGFPGQNRKTTAPNLASNVVEFETNSDQTEILVHVSNFHHRVGGMWETVYLGDARDIQSQREISLLFNFFLLGSIVIMGLYHIGLHWTRKDDKASLYFGVFCILMGIRFLATGERYILNMMPHLSCEWHCSIVYISFYLSVPVFLMYGKTLFRQEISSLVVVASQLVGVTLSLLVLLTPAKVFTYSMPFFQWFTILIICYGTWAVVVAAIHQKSRLHMDRGNRFLYPR
jgi:hypothetical protein